MEKANFGPQNLLHVAQMNKFHQNWLSTCYANRPHNHHIGEIRLLHNF